MTALNPRDENNVSDVLMINYEVISLGVASVDGYKKFIFMILIRTLTYGGVAK